MVKSPERWLKPTTSDQCGQNHGVLPQVMSYTHIHVHVHTHTHTQLSPPLLPPRGEVNAQDAFDIGNFDDDDTRGIKVRTCTPLYIPIWRRYMYTFIHSYMVKVHVHLYTFLYGEGPLYIPIW